jgi:hypothetical protein
MSAQRHRVLAAWLAILSSAAVLPAAQPPAPPLPPGPPLQVSEKPLDESWQHTLRTFDDWSKVQRLYSPEHMAQLRRQMLDKAASLSPDQSAQFRRETDARLSVLLSAEANDARQWLLDTLSVASDSYAKKVLAGVPDVAHASAGQLQQALADFEARHRSVQQYQAGLAQSRETAIQDLNERNRSNIAAAAEARAASAAPASFSGVVPNDAAQRTYERYRSPYGPTLPYFAYPIYGRFGAFVW